MAETEASPNPTPTFLEVKCKSSGKTRRFAVGTEAGFALSLINRRLESGRPFALHIEASREGEEPIAFGPTSALVDYGGGWKLQTVIEPDFDCAGVSKWEGVRPMMTRVPTLENTDDSRLAEMASKPVISFRYIGKIVIAFILIFVLGAIFTLALENLPRFIFFINSIM